MSSYYHYHEHFDHYFQLYQYLLAGPLEKSGLNRQLKNKLSLKIETKKSIKSKLLLIMLFMQIKHKRVFYQVFTI